MKPTYLYIKQHSITGMKYFGKTTKKDPIKYNGSGRYWQRHLKVHNKQYVQTLWVSECFTSEEKIVEFAQFFSEFFNIVKSSHWANEKVENGLDGGKDKGIKGRTLSDAEKKMHSDRMKVNNPMFNDAVKLKHKNAMNTIEIKEKRSKLKTGNHNVKGKSWYNNGIITKMFYTPPDLTWSVGRLNTHWNENRKNDKEKI
jgi:hypothetical protein